VKKKNKTHIELKLGLTIR